MQRVTIIRCNHAGCVNIALWRVGVELWAIGSYPNDGSGTVPCQAKTGLYVCNDCKKNVTVESLVTDQTWTQIVRGFVGNGFAKPDRKRIKTLFFPMEILSANGN